MSCWRPSCRAGRDADGGDRASPERYAQATWSSFVAMTDEGSDLPTDILNAESSEALHHEGADQLCLDALGSCERPPPYVSVETTLDSREEARRQFTTLRAFGYEAFKIVNQRLNAHYVCPDPPREGEFVPVRFDTLMSGPFGEETPGPWLSFDKAWRHYRGILVEQRMFGISGLLGTTPLARVYSGMRRRLLGAPVGWYDLHARHADSKRC